EEAHDRRGTDTQLVGYRRGRFQQMLWVARQNVIRQLFFVLGQFFRIVGDPVEQLHWAIPWVARVSSMAVHRILSQPKCNMCCIFIDNMKIIIHHIHTLPYSPTKDTTPWSQTRSKPKSSTGSAHMSRKCSHCWKRW